LNNQHIKSKKTKSQVRVYGDFIQTMRKKAIREQIVVEKDDPGRNVITFPNEKLGNKYDVNKAFVSHGVLIRDGQAYHNLHLEHLIMLDKHPLDKFKALKVDEAVDENIQGYYSSKTRVKGKMMDKAIPISHDNCQEFADQFLSEFSWSPRFFMHDGTLGSHAPCGNKVRFITNDTTTAIYVQQLLHSVSPDFENYLPETLIYHAPDLHLPKSSGPGILFVNHRGDDIFDLFTPDMLELISPEEKESMLKSHRMQIILAGIKSLDTIRDVLLASSTFFHTEAGGAAVRASTIMVDGKSVLVFNDTDIFSTGAMSKNLFSQDHSTLLLDGIIRTFNGVHFKASRNSDEATFSPSKGDIVSGRYIYQPMSRLTRQQVAPKPSAIFNVNYNYKQKTETNPVEKLTIGTNSKSSLVTFQSEQDQNSLWEEVTKGIPCFDTVLKRADQLEEEIRRVLKQ